MSTQFDKKSLKKVLVLRHGEYSGDSLVEKGITQMVAAIGNLSRKIEIGSKILLISSTLPRAMESSRIIARAFVGVEITECPLLRNDRYHDARHVVPEIMSHVVDHDVAIVVTHYELLSGIINYFSDILFGTEFPNEVPGNGKGYCIDLTTGHISNV